MATLIFLAALLIRYALLPVEGGLAFLTFYPATVLAFLLCGRGPGSGVVVLSALAGACVFTPPHWSFTVGYKGGLAVSVYLVSALMTGWIIARLQFTAERLAATLNELQRSERRYLTMLEEQTDAICRFSADGTVQYVNPAFCRLFDRPRDEIVGRVWQPLPLPEDIPHIHEQLSRLSPEQPVVAIENRVVAGNGVIRWGHFVNHATFDGQGGLMEIQSVGRDITERKQLEAGLASLRGELQDLYDKAPCGYFSLGAAGTFIRVNDTMLAWLGSRREDVIDKKSPLDYFNESGRNQFNQVFPKFKREGRIDGLEFDLCSADGSVRKVSVAATAVYDADGNFLMSRSAMFDITEMTRIKEQLLRMTREQNAMLDNELIGIVKVQDRWTTWTNRALERIFGYAPGELLGRPSRVLYPNDASYEAVGRAAYAALEAGSSYRAQVEMVRRDGTAVWIDLSGVQLSTGGGESMWMMADITQSRRHQEQVEHLAYHDGLTGLPNRLLLADRLKQCLSSADRQQRSMAVCYVDLDGFKAINDQHGHSAGDEVLKQVARRLEAAVRANDTVCRLGGDEFVVLLSQLTRTDEHLSVLNRLMSSIRQPITLGSGQVARLSASVGVALFPEDGVHPDVLLGRADQAMYESKQRGRNRIVGFRDLEASKEGSA